MSDYFDRFGGQFREMQRIMDRLQPQLRALDSIPAAVREQAEQIERFRLTLPTDYLGELDRFRGTIECDAQLYKLNSFAASESVAIREIIERQRQIEDLSRKISGYSDHHYIPSQRVMETLASTEALLATARLNRELVAAVVQPQVAFQEFAENQLHLASYASDMARANRFTAIESAAGLLEDMSRGLELAALMYPTFRDIAESPKYDVNVFSELTLELEDVDLEEQETDVEEVVLESKPAQVASQGGRIVRLVYDLNVEAERDGKPVIFKPTSKTLYSCSIIPTRVATDESIFAEVVDHLYFLIYEGSAKAARLLEKRSREDLKTLWMLKDLRTGFRHDVDHGAEKKINDKNDEIGQAYRSLIGKVAPRSKADCIQAQITLYSRLIEMLEAFWNEAL